MANTTAISNGVQGTLALLPIPTNTFTSLTGTTYSLGAVPSAAAATPKGTFLYVATLSGSVVLYTIGTNGALTLSNGGNAVVQTLTPVGMTVDPSGKWLFLISSSISALLEYQINPTTGVLTQVGSSNGVPLNPGGVNQATTQVYVTPNDQNVYVGLSSGGLNTFAFNSSTGALSNENHYATRSAGAADNSIAADTASKFLFVGEAGSGVRVFQIGSSASLTEISGSPFTAPLGPAAIVVDPTNQYLYVASRTTNVITGYTLASSGALTELSSSPFQAGSGPSAMSLDSTGKYLLVMSAGGSPDLQVFSFDGTDGGALDSVTTASTGTSPAGAVSLAVVP